MSDPEQPEPPGQDLPPLPGAEPLRAHIDSLDLSVTEWCEKHDLDRFMVQKLLNGKLQRVSVEIAFDIEAATDAVVGAELWVPEQGVRDVQQERRKASARARARALRERRSATGTDDGTN